MKPTTMITTRIAVLGLFAAIAVQPSANGSAISLTPIGSVTASTPPTADASPSEIVAHDPETQRLFVVNAVAAKIDVFKIENPSKPTLFRTIDVRPFGSVANSVAVHNGVLAVAVEGELKTDPGSVVFFRAGNLKQLGRVQVGALPDMVTFSPDGQYVVTANEGEPNADYSIDPEGSVSVIDLRRGAARVTQQDVRT